MNRATGRYLFDTNIVIALFAGDVYIISRLHEAVQIFISANVLGELYFGAQKSQHQKKNISRIRQFAQSVILLKCDSETALLYGQIKNSLKQIGNPIPENDIWIAATAMQHKLILITRDSHFSNIKDLEIQKW